MGCLLRIGGKKNFDIDKFDLGWKIKPAVVHRKGDVSFIKRGSKKRNDKTQLVYHVSQADYSDINKQIKEAIKFLKRNDKYLKKVSVLKTIDFIGLDFCINSRIDLKKVEVQNDYFPAELIKLAGNLNMCIWLTQWPYEKLKKNK